MKDFRALLFKAQKNGTHGLFLAWMPKNGPVSIKHFRANADLRASSFAVDGMGFVHVSWFDWKKSLFNISTYHPRPTPPLRLEANRGRKPRAVSNGKTTGLLYFDESAVELRLSDATKDQPIIDGRAANISIRGFDLDLSLDGGTWIAYAYASNEDRERGGIVVLGPQGSVCEVSGATEKSVDPRIQIAGGIYVTWWEVDDNRVWVNSRPLESCDWSGAKLLSQASAKGSSVRFTKSASGDLCAAWVQRDVLHPSLRRVFAKRKHGDQWEHAVFLGRAARISALSVAGQGSDCLVGWLENRTRLRTRLFSEGRTKTFELPELRGAADLNIALTDLGPIAIWSRVTVSNGPGHKQLYWMKWLDDGWTTPKPLAHTMRNAVLPKLVLSESHYRVFWESQTRLDYRILSTALPD